MPAGPSILHPRRVSLLYSPFKAVTSNLAGSELRS